MTVCWHCRNLLHDPAPPKDSSTLEQVTELVCVYCKATYLIDTQCTSGPKIGLKRLAEITNKPAP